MGTNPLPLNFGNIPLGSLYEERLVEDLLGGWHKVAITLAPAAGRLRPGDQVGQSDENVTVTLA